MQNDSVGSTAADQVSFEAWAGARSVPTLSSNVGSGELPFQSWRNFKEAFAPEIVARAIRETPRKIDRILDPFGGSGTTALTAQFLGVNPVTIEVNPYLADLIESKLATYDVTYLTKAFSQVVSKVWKGPINRSACFEGAPATFIEPGLSGKFIFSRNIAQRIVAYKNAISEIEDVPTKRLLRVIFASTLIPVSNVVISGKGRRYRQNWRENLTCIDEVDRRFHEGMLNAIHDIQRYRDRACLDYEVRRGDARSLIHVNERFDLAVFSPPYPNSFDYTDVYNVELWAMGYLLNSEDNKNLRKATLRSHVQILRDLSSQINESRTLSRVIKRLEAARDKLWNRHLPTMVAAYFQDMHDILLAIQNSLTEKGRIYAVVGDSQYADILVPTSKILTELAPCVGLSPLSNEEFRSMRASPQQGGSNKLSECLLIFEKN